MKVEVKDIHKAFGQHQVLRGVNMEINPGEVHALMGENGAGKSTLMNIVTGLLKQDQGQILIDGQVVAYENPKNAENNGVSFIHQELVTWPEMTVLENFFMGKELTKSMGLVDNAAMRQAAQAILHNLGIAINLNRRMGDLSVGQQQMIEIGKTLYNQAKVLIMDEPTAALTDREIRLLFKVIQQLKAEKVAIVYISHRMNEIFEIADRVTVMRDGVSIMTHRIHETSEEAIVRAMVGRDLEDYYPHITIEPGPVLLEVDHLTSGGKFQDISFHLREGEILGISGLMGAGRTEIMRAVFGLDPFDSGTIKVKGSPVTLKTPQQAIRHGIGFLTEDRKSEGLILDFSIKDNISLTAFENFSHRGFIDPKKEGEFVDLLVERLAVKTTSIFDSASSLSGGNQQKVVLAKWVAAGTQILILDEPTRGVDVGAKREIYVLMKELAQRGVGIVMISSDLPEIIGISDRVLVIHEGHLAGELDRADLSEERIMTYATGGA